MPRRDDIESILLIGSGPIVIGQACEFDYSGTQGAKALREEGYRIILVNSNPATIMTDPEFADRTYVEPLTPEILEAIIEREKPDAVLPTLGGQTALNLALALADRGVLEKHGVELIGANVDAIRKAEERELFKAAMDKIGLGSARAGVARTLEEAHEMRSASGSRSSSGRRSRWAARAAAWPTTRPSSTSDSLGLPVQPDSRVPGRREPHRLEGIRARGHSRQRRQLRRHLHHRELRPDGRSHRRLDHGGAGA